MEARDKSEIKYHRAKMKWNTTEREQKHIQRRAIGNLSKLMQKITNSVKFVTSRLGFSQNYWPEFVLE